MLRFSLAAGGTVVVAFAFICTAAVVAGAGSAADVIGAEICATEAVAPAEASVDSGATTAGAAVKRAGIALFAIGVSTGAAMGVGQPGKESAAGSASPVVGAALTVGAD